MNSVLHIGYVSAVILVTLLLALCPSGKSIATVSWWVQKQDHIISSALSNWAMMVLQCAEYITPFFAGRAWAATTTEGLLVYSLDHNLVFDPFELDIDITPANVRGRLGKQEYSTALMLSFRLNEQALIQEVLETIPVKDSKCQAWVQSTYCLVPYRSALSQFAGWGRGNCVKPVKSSVAIKSHVTGSWKQEAMKKHNYV